jgi:hypothetical protein
MEKQNNVDMLCRNCANLENGNKCGILNDSRSDDPYDRLAVNPNKDFCSLFESADKDSDRLYPAYRYWDSLSHSMGEVTLINFKMGKISVRYKGGEEFPVMPRQPERIKGDALLSWTMKFDASGKRIFQDDIVKTDEDGWIAIVGFDGTNFYLYDKKGGYSIFDIHWEKCTVLGNIYETCFDSIADGSVKKRNAL